MKYLITLPWMPYPATDGGKQGSFNMLMELQNMIDITLIYPVFFKKQMACQYLLEKQLPKVKVYPFEYYKNKDGIKSQYSLFRLHRIITRKFLKQPYLEFFSRFSFFVLFLFSGAVRVHSPDRIIINNF